jgi:hypothetical protein
VPVSAWNFVLGLFFFCRRLLGPSLPGTYFTFGFFFFPFCGNSNQYGGSAGFAADSNPGLAFHFDFDAVPDPDPDPTLPCPYPMWKIRNFFDRYLKQCILHFFIFVIRVIV